MSTLRPPLPLLGVVLALTLLLAACFQAAPEPLRVVAFEATDGTTFRVAFNRPLGPGAELADRYDLRELETDRPLAILSAALQDDGTTVLLRTRPQRAVPYALDVGGLVDRAGRPFDVAAGTRFTAFGIDRVLLELRGASAHGDRAVVVTFSKPVDERALNPLNYEIEGLVVEGAERLPDASQVRLATSRQERRLYTLFVRNVRDESGNAIDELANATVFQGERESQVVLVRATQRSATEIELEFSEPVGAGAERPENYEVREESSGEPLEVLHAELLADPTRVMLTTAALGDVRYVVRVANVSGASGGSLDLASNAVPVRAPHDRGPAVTGALSTGSYSVRVTFDGRVDFRAEEASNYRVTAGGERLRVRSARLNADRNVVTLETDFQLGEVYLVTVENVRDRNGHPIDATANRASFTGTFDPHLDSNGDGLVDWRQIVGWIVYVDETGDGVYTPRRVTADPLRRYSSFGPCKDLGTVQATAVCEETHALELRTYFTDLESFHLHLDPRETDTDGDGLTDWEEVNLYGSSPLTVDTAGDALQGGVVFPQLFDGSKVMRYGASPTLRDTSGDGISDFTNIIENNTSPLLAYVPRARIEQVGVVDLLLNATYTYTDSEGQVRSLEESVSSQLEQGETTAFTRSDARMNQASREESLTVGVKAEKSFPKGGGVSVEVEGSVSRGYVEEHTSSWSRESAEETRSTYAEQTAERRALERTTSVTTSAQKGEISVGFRITNESDVSFELRNLLVTALTHDRETNTTRAVATLTLNDAIGSGITLGPKERTGVLQVANAEASAARIRQLLANPTGIYFEAASFDLVDEDGRNFAFLRETTNRRTGLVTIDYGLGGVERFRVATNVRRNPDGSPQGIPMRDVMRIIDRQYETAFDAEDCRCEVVTRVGSTAEDDASFWVVISTDERNAPTNVDFGDMVLMPGQEIVLGYFTDRDEDGLFAREEYFYGTSDNLWSTARGIEREPADPAALETFSDLVAVRGWTVEVAGRSPYRVFPNPLLVDSNGDGCTDYTNWTLGTDPNLVDSSGDGVPDCDSPNPTGIVPGPSIAFGSPTLDHVRRSASFGLTIASEIELTQVRVEYGDGRSETHDLTGTTSDARTIDITYAQPGEYTVTVTVTDTFGRRTVRTLPLELEDVFPQLGKVLEYLFTMTEAQFASGTVENTAPGRSDGTRSSACTEQAADRFGAAGRALRMNLTAGGTCGSASYGSVSTAGELGITDSFTLSIWVRPGDQFDNHWLMGTNGNGRAWEAWSRLVIGGASLDGDGSYRDRVPTFVLRHPTQASRSIEVMGEVPIPTSGWTLLTVVVEWDGTWTNVTLYVNGTQVDSDRDSLRYERPTGDGQFFIGGSPNTGQTGGLAFFGSIDDVRIYDRALSAAEVDALLREGGFSLE